MIAEFDNNPGYDNRDIEVLAMDTYPIAVHYDDRELYFIAVLLYRIRGFLELLVIFGSALECDRKGSSTMDQRIVSKISKRTATSIWCYLFRWQRYRTYGAFAKVAITLFRPYA